MHSAGGMFQNLLHRRREVHTKVETGVQRIANGKVSVTQPCVGAVQVCYPSYMSFPSERVPNKGWGEGFSHWG